MNKHSVPVFDMAVFVPCRNVNKTAHLFICFISHVLMGRVLLNREWLKEFVIMPSRLTTNEWKLLKSQTMRQMRL